jgi:TetR/AcrR family transcriptional regulator
LDISQKIDNGSKPPKANRKRKDAGEQAVDLKIREKNEQLIMSAATDLFSRKGFDGTRSSEIAELAGLPKANLYYYFGSKEAIYTAILQKLIAGWDHAIEHVTVESDPIKSLETYVYNKIDYARANKGESRLFANEILSGGAFLSKADQAHMTEVALKYAAIVQQWIDSGKLKPVDPKHLFIMLFSAVQYYVDYEKLAAIVLGKKSLSAQDYRDAAATIVNTTLEGIRV